MTHLGVKDLPSIKCIKDLKNTIKFEDIIKYIKRRNSEKIREWVSVFKTQLLEYLNNSTHYQDTTYPNKRCRDLNHILDMVIGRILKQKLDDKINFYHNTESFALNILNGSNSLKCRRIIYDENYPFRHLRKMFDDFCEDSLYVSSNIDSIKKSPKCRTIMSNIRYRRDDIVRILNKNRGIPRDLLNFSDKCNGYNIEMIHKTTNCMTVTHAEDLQGSVPLAQATGDLDLSLSADDPEVLDPDSSEASGLVEREIQEYESSEHLNIAYAVSSVFGTGLFSYFLYRATPVGSWIRSKVLSNTQNDFSMFNDGSDNSLSNSIDTLQLNMDNYEYNMPYAGVG
ncbi:PIR Superfamily Protein [Plasmodium ovale wallikeri]|uniref:PIR Superfamily Protein n=2 Tax=Plasmodium ovale TaxID=36330 RepID=A0A1A9ATV7_PLAOA|nr:PIR Superfamily Protein [Plasmodium ovale wallikeri]SBT59567.1 PIR Superfamily Protein [Plasmodium ovale wallikeri]SBT73890.1 PIR protein [Plasmodium ovale]